MAVVEQWAEVGERIREARNAMSLTQSELATRIRIDRTALVRVEAGERGVSALELTRIAETLGIPIAHFVNRSPGPVAAYRAAVADSAEGGLDDSAERTRFLLDVALEEHARDAEWLYRRGLIAPVPSLPSGPVADRAGALELAREARRKLDNHDQPLGPMAAVAEKFGLFVKVVPDGTAGASMQIESGLGVAVVGEASDPGRRRATAAHELGHHLFGDKYNSDAGVAASERERERLIDHFVAEFLLPEDVVTRRIKPGTPPTEVRASLVALSGEYRLSWSVVVNSACRLGLVRPEDEQGLRVRNPGRGDFMAVLGCEPRPDLLHRSSGPVWRKAVLAAWSAALITAERTVHLLNGVLTREELPARQLDGDPA